MVVTELAQELGSLLREKGACVTTAESCTGGGVAEAITRIAGSSAWFEAGYVTYSNAQKTQMLGVSADTIKNCGAVSLPVVEAMVRGACWASGAKYGVAISGIAGPDGGTPMKPVGTVCFAWLANGALELRTYVFAGDRAAVRLQSVQKALAGLISMLRDETNFD